MIKLRNLPVYYLNYDGYTDRKQNMEKLFSSLNITDVTRIGNNLEDSLRQNRISKGLIKLLNLAIENNTFPIITMDDDMEIIDIFPDTISIPQETDLIFLGGSLYNCGGIKPNMYFENYNEEHYRVYYMQSLHSMVIPHIQSAYFLIDVLKNAILNDQFSDIEITMHSENKIFLSPKNGPYFYQNNYNEPVTNFLWKNFQ